jgi:hypothetical protein
LKIEDFITHRWECEKVSDEERLKQKYTECVFCKADLVLKDGELMPADHLHICPDLSKVLCSDHHSNKLLNTDDRVVISGDA